MEAISFCFALFHPLSRSIASARLCAPTVRSNNRRAAGVRFPSRSRRVVQLGGGIASFFTPRMIPSRSRMLLLALWLSLREMTSRWVGSAMQKGVGGSSMASEERMRGVPARVPQVISSFMRAGPSWSGVGVGRLGTRLKESEELREVLLSAEIVSMGRDKNEHSVLTSSTHDGGVDATSRRTWGFGSRLLSFLLLG